MDADTNKTRSDMIDLAKHWAESCAHVQAYVHSVISNYNDAEDVIQQIAASIAEHYDRYDPNRPFRYWAIGVARNNILEYFKSRSKKAILFDNHVLDSYTAFYEEDYDPSSDIIPRLKRCIARLPKRSKQIIRLHYFEGMTTVRIATLLDTSSNVIRVTLYRIRKALRECVSRQAEHTATSES